MTPYDNLDGGSQVARQLVAEARRRGQPASLISFDWDKLRSEHRSGRGAAFWFWCSLQAVKVLVSAYRIHPRAAVIAIGDAAAVHAVVARDVLRRKQISIVAAQHQPTALSEVVRRSPRSLTRMRALIAWVIDAIHRQSDAYVFLTEQQQEDFLRREPKARRPMAVIPNAVRFPAAGDWEIEQRLRRIQGGGKLRVLHVGTFSARKNQALAVQALALLSDETASLAFAGSGNQEEVSALAKKLGVLSRVKFLGEVEDMQSVYDEHDVLLSTALIESFGLTAIEGLVRGLLVVGPSEVPLFRDIAERFPTAFAFHRCTPDDVATQIHIAVEAVRAEEVGPRQFHDAIDDCEAGFSVANLIAGHDAVIQRVRCQWNGGQSRLHDFEGGLQ